MPPYAEGKVYVVLNTVNDKKYVGSTVCALSKRMGQHRMAAKAGDGLPMYVAMRELGIEKFYVELIEDVPCERREQLHAAEGRKIRELGTLVPNGYNMFIAGRKRSEYYQENRAKIIAKVKEYNDARAEERKARTRAFRAENGAMLKARANAFREAHAEEIRAKDRERYAANRIARIARQKAYDDARRAKLTPEQQTDMNKKKYARRRELQAAKRAAAAQPAPAPAPVNREAINARRRALIGANREANRAYQRARRAAKRAAAAQPAPVPAPEPEPAPEPVAK